MLGKDSPGQSRADRFMSGLADEIRPLADPLAIQQIVCRLVSELLEADRAYYAEIDASSSFIQIEREFCQAGIPSMIGRCPLASYPWIRPALEKGSPLIVADTTTAGVIPDSDRSEFKSLGIGSFIAAPLVKDEHVIGAFCIASKAPRVWEPAEGRLVTKTAELLWSSVERAKADRVIRDNEQRRKFLTELSETLQMLRDPVEIQETACHLLGKHLSADRVGYAEAHGDGETVVVTRSYTRGAPGLEGRYRLDDHGADLLHDFRAGHTVVRPDVATDPRLSETEKQAHASLGLGATLNRPLLKQGELFGVLFVHYGHPHDFTDEELLLTEETAERTWSAVARARSEEALLLSEGRYRTLFDSIDEGFCLIEVLFDESDTAFDYRFIEANPAFERHTGLSNAVGRTILEMVPAHEKHWFKIYGEIAKSGTARRFEEAAGAMGRFYDVYAFRVGDPEARQVAVLFNDVTKRKNVELRVQENEERLRTLFESMNEGFVIKEAIVGEDGRIADFRFIECNPAFTRMTGLKDPAGCTVRELMPAAEPVWFDSFNEVLATGRPVQFEAPIGGGDHWWSVSASRIGGPGSLRVAIVLTDVTARKHSEEALKRASEELEQRVAERTKDLESAMQRLQAEAAERERLERDRHDLLKRQVKTQEDERKRISRELHDNLGQYLTAIMLRVQLMRKAFESGEPLVSITDSIDDLKSVVDSLMKASHRQAWELRPAELDHFGLEAALRAYVTDWSDRTGIRTIFDSHQWKEVRLDPDCEIALYRVVQEALTNVARHAAASQVVVTLQSNGHIEVHVRDDGKGFDPKVASKRLGLLGMKERLSLADGCLTVESAPGQGTLVSATVSRPACGSSASQAGP